MPRTRYIKPDFFLDEDLADMSALCRLLFIGLWLIADRDGKLEDRPKRIKVQIFPYDSIDTDLLLWELAEKFIIRYQVGEKKYIQIKNFHKHQRPHPKESPSTFPDAKDRDAVKLNCKPCKKSPSREIKPRQNRTRLEQNLNFNSNRERKIVVFKEPTIEQIKDYCIERGNPVDSARWWDFYSSKGWMIGKNKMKDWRACVRTWEPDGFKPSKHIASTPACIRCGKPALKKSIFCSECAWCKACDSSDNPEKLIQHPDKTGALCLPCASRVAS